MGEQDAAIGKRDDPIGGSAAIRARDATGIKEIKGLIAVRKVSLKRLVGMPEERKIGVSATCMGDQTAKTALDPDGMPVQK